MMSRVSASRGVGGSPAPPFHGALDAALRFTGEPAAAAALEASFAGGHALAMRRPRAACLAFLGIAYAASFAVYYFATAVPDDSDWLYLVVAGFSFALVPGVRAGHMWAVDASTAAGTALFLFAFDLSAGIEACLSGELPPDEMHTELAAVADGVRVMTALLNDLLDLQKMRTGKFSVKVEVASPQRAVQGCVRAVQPAVSVPILVSVESSVPEWILTDELRVRQIIMNGLTNAAKYSNAPENGPIRVVVRAGDNLDDAAAASAGPGAAARAPAPHAATATTVEVPRAGGGASGPPPPAPFLYFEVLDCGPGLCGVDEKALFADFTAPTSGSSSHTGSPGTPARHTNVQVGSSGVGLPICARLAKLLDGELRVTDRTDGVRGTRFRLRLPLRVPPAATTTAAASTAAAFPTAAATSPAAAGPFPRDSQTRHEGRGAIILVKRNVLIVDDSEGNRRLLRRMLQQLGCRVIEAADGDEVAGALAAAAAADPTHRGVDMVLMDIDMARVGGVAAVRGLREGGWVLPVIAVTGHAGADTAAEYVSHGFNAVLVKPFLRDKLRDVLLAASIPRATRLLPPPPRRAGDA